MIKEISIKDTIGIREYMENYLKVDYEGSGRLTHHKMNVYLAEKGYHLPTKVSLHTITEEQIKKGRCLLVREEQSKKKAHIVAYMNPIREDAKDLFSNKTKEQLQTIREKILREKGFRYDDFGQIISEEELLDQMTVTIKLKRNAKYTTSFHKRGK